MRIPLGLRVVLWVTAFNLAVFGGGLAWITQRLSDEQAELSRLDESLVLERLRNLLDVRGKALTSEILDWPRWRRYADAQIVQLKGFEPTSGLLSELRQVGSSTTASFVPSGFLVPLKRPRGGPRNVTLPLERPFLTSGRQLPFVLPALLGYGLPLLMGGASVRVPLPRQEPGPIWGACLLPDSSPWPDRPQLGLLARDPVGLLCAIQGWPLHLARALSRAAYIGLSPNRQRVYDRRIGPYLGGALRSTRASGSVLRFQGGVLLPLVLESGEAWGAGFFPFRVWWRLLPGPFFSPAGWWSGAIIDPLETDASPADLRRGGIFLNPMGSAHRSPGWDQDSVLADVRRAAVGGVAVQGERGLAVPLRLSSGELWGGVWLEPRRESLVEPVLQQLAPWFLLSTLLLTLTTFVGLRNLVLEPVRRLARGARLLSEGNLGARVPEIRRRDELADLVRDFNSMAGDVEGFNARLEHEVQVATRAARDAEAAAITQRRLAATGELAAGIAHEINNPLGGMLNAVDVLARADIEPEMRAEYIELVRSGLERVRQTVGKVLRLAPRETALEPLNLVDPLADALGLVRHRAAQLGATLTLEGAGGARTEGSQGALDAWRALPGLRGQPNELGQAILNLLVNALDALEDGLSRTSQDPVPEVRVGLEADASMLHLWVLDNGPGMDPESLARAADLFFSTKQVGRGTGLGLAIVHNVVSGHGGRVQLASPSGGGFRADVWLPLSGPLAGDQGGGDGVGAS